MLLVPAFLMVSTTLSPMNSLLAKSVTGSMFPCTAWSIPSLALASAMSTVPSSEMTSAPVVCSRSSKPPLPELYRIRGRSGCVSFTSATTRLR